MERTVVRDKENYSVTGNKTKGEKMAKGPAGGTVSRKTLADISNLQQQNQIAKPQSITLNTKEYIDKLHQENMTLVKLLADKNKIIELSAIELRKLRINYQKVQQQNQQLAQANSQMLAELNTGKDRLKALQHELGCKNGLLQVRKLDSKPKANRMKCGNYGNKVEILNCDEADESSQADKEGNKLCDAKKTHQSKTQCLEPSIVKPVHAKGKVNKERIPSRRQSARFKSGEEGTTEDLVEIGNALGPITIKTVKAEEKVDKKSLCCRQRSPGLKSQEQAEEPTEDTFQTDDAKFPVSSLCDDLVPETDPMSSVSSVKKECEAESSAFEFGGQGSRRSSVRPVRRAREKVQSYKETPLNVKMRRTE